MTLSTDKPKRKEKPKRVNSRTRWIILLLLSLSIMIGLGYGVYISLIEQADGSKCVFESNPHILVNDREEVYITDFTGETHLTLPDSFDTSPVWSVDTPYVWGTFPELMVANLETLTTFSFNISTDGIEYSVSPSHRYLVLQMTLDSGLWNMVIYDGDSLTMLAEFETPNFRQHWTPDDSTLLLRSSDLTSTQLFDVATLELSDANLPADVANIGEWIDATRLLYITPAGRFRTWDRITGETDSLYDIRIDSVYTAGGERFPNSRIRSPWFGGIDSDGMLHLVNMMDGSQYTHNVDTSRVVHYIPYPLYIELRYPNTEPREYAIYHPETGIVNEFIAPEDEQHRLSSDGEFFFYDPPENRGRDYIIQEVATGETMELEGETAQELRWVDIEGQPYLSYPLRMEDGTLIHYLLQPDTKERCIVGKFNTISIDIQS